VSDLTGQVIDVRRIDPTAGGARVFAGADPDAVVVGPDAVVAAKVPADL
jgi:hypothetical protein